MADVSIRLNGQESDQYLSRRAELDAKLTGVPGFSAGYAKSDSDDEPRVAENEAGIEASKHQAVAGAACGPSEEPDHPAETGSTRPHECRSRPGCGCHRRRADTVVLPESR